MANPNSDMRVTRELLTEYAEKYKNWGRWGPDDEIGTLNFTSPEDIIGAVDVQSGEIVGYQANSNYRTFTAAGLIKLPTWFMDRLREEYRALPHVS